MSFYIGFEVFYLNSVAFNIIATIYFIVPTVLYNYWFIQSQKEHPTDAL